MHGGLRVWGPLGVYRPYRAAQGLVSSLFLPLGQIIKCFIRKLHTYHRWSGTNGGRRSCRLTDSISFQHNGRRRRHVICVSTSVDPRCRRRRRRCPSHLLSSLSQTDLAPFSSLMKRRQRRKNEMATNDQLRPAAAEIDIRRSTRSHPHNIIPTLPITSR